MGGGGDYKAPDPTKGGISSDNYSGVNYNPDNDFASNNSSSQNFPTGNNDDPWGASKIAYQFEGQQQDNFGNGNGEDNSDSPAMEEFQNFAEGQNKNASGVIGQEIPSNSEEDENSAWDSFKDWVSGQKENTDRETGNSTESSGSNVESVSEESKVAEDNQENSSAWGDFKNWLSDQYDEHFGNEKDDASPENEPIPVNETSNGNSWQNNYQSEESTGYQFPEPSNDPGQYFQGESNQNSASPYFDSSGGYYSEPSQDYDYGAPQYDSGGGYYDYGGGYEEY